MPSDKAKREYYERNRVRQAAYNRAHPCTPEQRLVYRIRHLMKKHGSTEKQYYLDAANGCQVCGSFKKLCIDHDHNTGLYRGVLCWKCNIAIGHLREDGALCLRAANYLGSGMLSPKEITQYE